MIKNRARKGFTLIELLVVILILGILTAVALPAYLSSVRDARTRTADTSARAIATAIQSAYVRAGGTTYVGITLATPSVVADMGGAIPPNPCGGSYTLGGPVSATGMTVTADNTSGNCNTPAVFTLGVP